MNKTKVVFWRVHSWIESLPEKLYPFANQIEGKFVRGRKSYEFVLKSAIKKYGPHKIGYKLLMYRSACHCVGSVIFIALATFLSQKLFNTEIALYVLFSSAIVALFVQEFYWHPKQYSQTFSKSVADWCTWVLPMTIYLSMFKVV
jgi:cyanate permease